jgi:hypothetical protein
MKTLEPNTMRFHPLEAAQPWPRAVAQSSAATSGRTGKQLPSLFDPGKQKTSIFRNYFSIYFLNQFSRNIGGGYLYNL